MLALTMKTALLFSMLLALLILAMVLGGVSEVERRVDDCEAAGGWAAVDMDGQVICNNTTKASK